MEIDGMDEGHNQVEEHLARVSVDSSEGWTKENVESRPNSAASRIDEEARHQFLFFCNSLMVARHDWSLPTKLLSSASSPMLSQEDSYGKTALHFAVRANAPKALLETLIEKGVKVDAADYDGWTPLHLAVRLCKSCDINLAKTLLARGADLNRKTNIGEVPLLLAVLNNADFDLIDLLLRSGGNPNISNAEGETPLILVARYGVKDPRIVQALLKHGANQFDRDKRDRNALDWGRENGHDDIVRAMRRFRLQNSV